jgi:hypothetical protein
MENVGYTILAIIIMAIIVGIIKAIGNSAERAAAYRKYDKAIENSNGLEKMRLILRRNAITFSLGLTSHGEDKGSSSGISIPILSTHMNICDIFYGQMQELYKNIDSEDPFIDLADEIKSDYTKQRIMTARIFGVAFGVILAKAANTSNKKVKKNAVKKYIDTCKIDEVYRKEIAKTALLYINFETDKLFGARSEGAFTSKDLGQIAYLLLDSKLGKGDFADPIIATHMHAALALSYGQADVSYVLNDMEKEGLIG